MKIIAKFSFIFLLFLSREVDAFDGKWRELYPGFEMVDGVFSLNDLPVPPESTGVKEEYENIRYTAIRVDRRKYRFYLETSEGFFEKRLGNSEGIEKSDEEGGRKHSRTLPYSLFGMSLTLEEGVLALVPVGWAERSGFPKPVGWVRVNGEDISDKYASPSLSALLCVDNKVLKNKVGIADYVQIFSDFDYNPPKRNYYDVDYTVDNIENFSDLKECLDIVQVGPTLIESNIHRAKDGNFKIGIKKDRYDSDVFAWTVLASDSSRSTYYVISFNDPISLYYAAQFLSSDKFYGYETCPKKKRPGANSCEHWAIALTGERYSGLAVRVDGEFLFSGNKDTIIPAVFVLKKIR